MKGREDLGELGVEDAQRMRQAPLFLGDLTPVPSVTTPSHEHRATWTPDF